MTPTTPRTVSARAARRFLVRRHLLLPPRSLPPGPASVLDVFARLGSIQFDPLEIAGRNHDLVLLARIAGYRRSMTDSLLYEERRLFETYNKGLSLLPVDELPWYRVFWDRLRIAHEGGAFDEHAPLVQELLDRIRRDGVLSSTDVEPRAAIDWYWRPTNQVRALLEALAEAGILGIARRDGNRRLYDLVERLFPTELLDRRIRPREQFRHKLLSRYRAHGLLGTSGSAELWNGTAPGKAIGAEDGLAVGAAGRRELHAELVDVGELVPVEVEGVRGVRFVVRSDVEMLTTAAIEAERDDRRVPWEAGVAFLAPLDPLVWDRDLLRRLFDFDYVWEVYVPAARRRWGYYVLPILFGDRLVGRIEPRIDRITRSLRVLGLWWEDGFDPLDAVAAPGFVDGFAAAIRAHLGFGAVDRVVFPRVARHRPFVRGVRERLAVGDASLGAVEGGSR